MKKCDYVAIVKFENNEKSYKFAAYKEDLICVGDYVVCDASVGRFAAQVMQLTPVDEWKEALPTREIIGKADLSHYFIRKEKEELAIKLKEQLDEKLAKFQELALYELMAKENPDVLELLNTYKELI